ncbi:MAG: nuclear transport factor 2 family protein [Ilumatobacteraceae bacterium]
MPRSCDVGLFDLVVRVGTLIHTGFATADEGVFADDFVFHYVDPHLSHIEGDHHGYNGFRRFFEQLEKESDTGFHNEPHSLTPYGDELVVAYATNTLSFTGNKIDVDAIVVWRIVDGCISEAWDIPAINTVRPHRPPAG